MCACSTEQDVVDSLIYKLQLAFEYVVTGKRVVCSAVLCWTTTCIVTMDILLRHNIVFPYMVEVMRVVTVLLLGIVMCSDEVRHVCTHKS